MHVLCESWGSHFVSTFCTRCVKKCRHSGYFEKTKFINEAVKDGESGMIHFYDSNTGKLLYTAPKDRTLEDFLVESRAHGWPSFRGT
jgi:hypothetical protein